MFKWLRNKKQSQENLLFKSPDAAMEFACSCLDNSITIGNYLPAIILSPVLSRDHLTGYLAKLPDQNGGFTNIAFDSKNERPNFLPGDLVSIQIKGFDPTKEYGFKILCGIEAKIKPEFHIHKGWVIE